MIDFVYKHQMPIPVNEEQVISWIEEIIENEDKELGDITYIFVDDEEILDLNIQTFDHHYYTDIITHNFVVGDVISGDFFISVDTVVSNSTKFETPFRQELYRVIIHGVLHLLGYNDKTEEEQKVMRAKENESLQLVNLF